MTRELERGNRVLFRTSSLRVALASTVALTPIVLALGPAPYLALLGAMFLFLAALRDPVLTWARALAVSSVGVLLTAVADLAALAVSGSYVPLVGHASAATVASASMVHTRPRGKPIAVAPFLVTTPIALAYVGDATRVLLPLGLVGPPILLYNALLLRGGSVNPHYAFSAFMRHVLAGDGSALARLFEGSAVEREVTIHVFRLRGLDGAELPPIVVSEAHPGPLRGVGGALLVERLSDGLGGRAVFLHGAGSHENDPVGVGDVDIIVNAVRRAMNGGVFRRDGAVPTLHEDGEFRLVRFGFPAMPIITVSRKGKSSDDLPSEVQRAVMGRAVVVDAQNRYGEDSSWSSDEVDRLIRALSSMGGAPCSDVSVGVSHVGPSELTTFSGEVLGNGIYVIYVESCGVPSLLVVVDGNNMAEGTYAKLLQTVNGLGVDIAEVVTTDNHAATGIAYGRGYRIVGERGDPEELAAAVRRAACEAMLDARPVEVAYIPVKATVRVLGEEGFAVLRRLASRGLQLGVAGALTYLAGPVIAAVITAMI